MDAVDTVSEKLKHKLSIHAPPKILVEKYLIEIAKNYNVPYEPDPQVSNDKCLQCIFFNFNNMLSFVFFIMCTYC